MYQAYSAPSYRTVGRSYYSLLVAFPVSCFVLTLLTDLAYWQTASAQWETISVWLIAVGLLGAGLALIGGLADLVRSRRLRGLGQPPMRLVAHAVAVALAAVNVLVHSRDAYSAVVPQGLVLSALTVLALLVAALPARAVRRQTIAGGLA